LKVTYKDGKDYELYNIDDAVAEFFARKETDKHPVIISVAKGYIVSDAVFKNEGGTNE